STFIKKTLRQMTVSYTHLDVYKKQSIYTMEITQKRLSDFFHFY
ncbi:hypothetical protein A5844_000247, partial [Enterococcus sp. 10A9_DIV0425]